jgi:hypothetical protein
VGWKGRSWHGRKREWCAVPVLLCTFLTVSACGSGSFSAPVGSRQFFVNVGSNDATYYTWIETADGSIEGSSVGAARLPDGTTQVPSPTPFTGRVAGHRITFDFGPSVQGGEATLRGNLGPSSLTITYPPSNGSCKTNPVVVYKPGSLTEFNRLLKHLSTVPTCLSS